MRDELNKALKDAMKAQDKRRLPTLRLILAAIKDRDLGMPTGADASAPDCHRISETEIAQILSKMIRQRRESIKVYEEAGRLELAEKEKAEITIIEEFLPRQLGDAEMRAAIKETLAELGVTGIKDMGRAMAALKARYQGQMDFGKASTIVKELL